MSVFKRWNGTTWEIIGPNISSVRFDNINNMIAQEFDPKSTYNIDDYVIKNDKLYKCINNIEVPKPWIINNWKEVKIGQDITELKNDIVIIDNAQPTSKNNKIWIKPNDDGVEIPLVEDAMMLPNPNDYGENNQIPRSTGSGIEWVDYGLPSDQQTEDAINNWLNAHPEATTTVQDNSLTYNKFVKGTFNFVTPEMFGAAGDGVTDDTEAFNELFSFGSSIVFLRNHYLISSITVPEKTVIIGGEIISDGTANTENNPKNVIEIGSDVSFNKVKFSDKLLENQQNLQGNFLYGHQINNIQITNCLFENIHLGSCIYLSESSNIDITYNIIDHYAFSGIMLFNGCTDINVCYNKVKNGTYIGGLHRYPICLSGYTDTSRGPAYRIRCNYNLIDDSEANPEWEGIDSHSCCDAEIKFNTIIGTKSGIVVTNPTSAPAQPNKNVVIEGNNITINSEILADGIAVTNRQICENISIIRNNINIINCEPGQYTAAIRTATTNAIFNNLKIIDNIISTKGQGIYLTSQILKNINIINNYIDGCSGNNFPATKIVTQGFEEITINNNKIGTIQPVTRGIVLQNTNTLNNSELIMCHNNIFGDVTTKFVNTKMLNKPSKSSEIKTLLAGKIGDFVPSDCSEDGIAGFLYNGTNWNIIPCTELI